jgi:hypothetical protein
MWSYGMAPLECITVMSWSTDSVQECDCYTTYTGHRDKYAEEPHLEAGVPDAVATSETAQAEPADGMMAQQTPLLKEPVLWQRVASLWCCHLGMPLGDQSTIEPVNSLKCKWLYTMGSPYVPWSSLTNDISPGITETEN